MSSTGAGGVPSTALTRAAVRGQLHAASEVNDPAEHFTPAWPLLNTPDGHGGTLSAVGALRTPSGDGRGQAVFFWHDGHLVGTAPRYEALGIKDWRVAGSGMFAITYADYASGDAMCCPSRFVTIRYQWTGHALAPTSREPSSIYDGNLRVRLP
ncbi:MAG TPA: LppP/LprE family lipoprotein [Mycobacterium sp.]|nr:LppP/LprE family lipoprotein [Mycobacterium sp.]